MNDFLTSMLDRAAGRAPTLQPRRPSVFEPVAPSRFQESAIDAGFGEEKSVVERPAPHVHRLPAPVAVADGEQIRPVTPPRSPALPQMDQPAPETKAARAVGGEFHEAPPVREGRPAPVTERLANPAVHTETFQTVIHTREIVREVAVPSERREERKMEATAMGIAAPSRAAASVAPPPVAPKASALPKLTPEPIRPRTVESTPALVPKAPVPQIRRVAAEPHRIAARTPQVSRTQEARVEAPVRVTIGSIEIRTAATPAPVPQKARTAGPKLKLDDYLAARRGGSR